MSTKGDPRRRRYMVGGIIVVAVALWIILDAAGVGVPSLGRFWPIFAIIGGLASIVDFLLGSRLPSSLGKGVAGIGFGLLFFGFTYRYLSWLEVRDWLPALPLIVGAAFLATWLGGNRAPSLLVMGVVGLGLGLTFYAPRFDWLAELLPPVAVVWGAILLALGLYLLWRAFRRNRGSV